eukprot:8767869-Alexandrium_andersonii.AAC.1
MSPQLRKGAAGALVRSGAWQSGLKRAAQTAMRHSHARVRILGEALGPAPTHKEYVRRTYTAKPSMPRGS